MKAATSIWEIDRILSIGIRIEYGQELGRTVQIEDLLKDYHAVFLGIGLGPDRPLPVLGSENPRIAARILGAVDFISRLKMQPSAELNPFLNAQTALVVGGGNTALDACRELKGLKIPRVALSYRRSESEMSGYTHELSAAKQEGVELHFNTLPTEYQPQGESIRATLRKTRISTDGKVELLDQKMILDTDLILIATGQSHLNLLSTHATRVFSGGDFANGGKEVVNAVAEGKQAAQAIHEVISHG